MTEGIVAFSLIGVFYLGMAGALLYILHTPERMIKTESTDGKDDAHKPT